MSRDGPALAAGQAATGGVDMSRYAFPQALWVCALTLDLLAAAPAPAAATAAIETTAADTDRLPEITVTAQRREQSLQDVGTSITAFDAASLQKLGLRSTTDIVQQVPGMQFQTFSPTITIFNLRGISQNDFGDHHEAPVAVYSDDVYQASMSSVAGSMYDQERVEVLRGPQGTLFGRNATGGLIHYLSVKPSLDGVGGYVNVSGGKFSDLETEGALNLPVNDSFATRFSFATSRHDGLISNFAGPDANSQNQYAARFQVLDKISDAGDVLLKVYGLRNIGEVSPSYAWGASCNDHGPVAPGSCPAGVNGLGAFLTPTQNPYGTCPGCDESGYRDPSSNPFVQGFDRQGIFDRSLYGLTAHVNWNFGAVKLTSVTDYMHLHKRYGEDSDGSPNFQFNFDTYQTYHQFSQELHLSGTTERFRWITGAYFLDLHNDDIQDENVKAPLVGFIVHDQGNQFTLDTRSWALFGQTEWEFADHLTLITGARYTRDDKRFNYTLWNPAPGTPLLDANGVPFVYNSSTAPGLADRNFDLYSGKIELDFKPEPGLLFYGSVNRGPKGGGWSAPSNPPGTFLFASLVDVIAYKPETLVDYEVGTKATILNGRGRINADVFYYDYRNYQAFFLRDFTQIIGNVDAKLEGGEVEFAVVPVHGLTLELGVAALSTHIKNVVLPDGSTADREMPNAPKWSANVLARYEWPTSVGTWSASVDGKWNASQWLENVNAPVDFQPSYAVADVHVGYAPNERLSFDAWVKNLSNKYYRVYNLDLSGLGYNESVYGPPRWEGITVSYRFGK
jgi:iron complex outermembrane receptor protein